jgi:DNA-binding SARP family transcriptional activator
MVRFAILGSVQLTDGTGEIAVGGPRQVALLAYLLLHANRPVSSDELIESVWADGDAGRAAKRLTVAIARLRRALAASGLDPTKALATTSAGYRLCVDQGQLDADVFEQHAADARSALATGHAARAGQKACVALGLWRGPPLTGVEYESFAQAEIRRLKELRLEVLETRIEADLRLGAHAAVVAELEGLVAAHPTREGLTGQLMLALYRSGRQAEALDAYQRIRHHLDSELGLQPGAALNELQSAILGQSPTLEAVASHESRAPSDEARAQKPAASPLPMPLASATSHALIGRTMQLERLTAALQRAKQGEQLLALVVGEPGIGKTRLMAEFAERARDEAAVVLYGRSSKEPLIAYQPFAEALRRYVAVAPLATLREEPAYAAAELTRLVPSLRRRLTDLPEPVSDDVEGQRGRLFDAVASLLANAARGHPVVLVLDDVHWADRSSVLLLTYVLRFGEPTGVLCVAASRDTEGPALPELASLIVDLRREHRLEQLDLEGLSEPELADLATARATDLNSTTSHEVYLRSGGNPFFAIELLAGIADGAFGSGATEPASRQKVMALPQEVTQAIDLRIDRLRAPAARLLSYAALLAPDIEIGSCAA